MISHKRDIILGGGLFVVATVLLFLSFVIPRKTGNYLLVKAEGKVVGAYRLDVDQVAEPIHNFYGGENQIIIQNGEAYMDTASCNKQICKHMGKVSKVGEMIICIPNELFLTVTDSIEGGVTILGKQ